MFEAADAKLNVQKPVASAPVPGVASGLRSAMEQATLGATMLVKGELSGAQSFFVDGRVEGSIRFPDHRVTIGRTAVVLANIEAKEVVIMGTVTGNIDCSDRVDIRSDGSLTGDVIAARISIEDGAFFKGGIDIRKSGQAQPPKSNGEEKATEPAAVGARA